jgi:transcriptional regulator with XRE-family HTH domain
MPTFGAFIRQQREKLKARDSSFSLRKTAAEIGVQPSYLSKVERGQDPPPSEEKIRALAGVLGEDPDVLLAMAGKISSDLHAAICRRPQAFARLIRELTDLPDGTVEQIAREVRDGRW